MNCPYCGELLDGSAKFCSKCGQRIPESAPEEEKDSYVPDLNDMLPEEEIPTAEEIIEEEKNAETEQEPAERAETPVTPSAPAKDKKPFPVKTVVIAAVCALVAAAFVLLFALVLGGSGDYIAMDRRTGVISAKEGDTYIVYTDDGTVIDLKTEEFEYARYCLDGTIAAFLMDVDGDNGGKLAVLRKGELATVSKDVCAFDISVDGGTVIYLRDKSDDGCKVCLYDVAKGESTELGKKATDMGGFTVSPDGRTAAWCTDLNYEKESFTGYISINGKAAEELGKNCYPIAISDGGKYIYYLKVDMEDGEMTAYVRHKGNDEKLCTLSYNDELEIWFNADFSEAMYLDDEYRTYLTVKGGEKLKISGHELYSVLLPRDAVTRYVGFNSVGKYVVPCATFAEKFITLDGDIYFLDKSFDTERVFSDYDDYQVGGDCTSLLVAQDGELLYIKNAVRSCEEEKVCEDLDIDDLAASTDLSRIYVRSEDEELYSFRLGKEPERVADDVYSFVVTEKGDALIIADWSDRHGSGDLSFVRFGKDKVKLCEDVTRVTAVKELLVYRQQTEDDSYLADFYTGDGKTFIKIADDVPAN